MGIRFHTAAAIIVLLASGAWVATGEYSFVGSDIAQAGEASTAEASAPASAPSEAPASDARQTVSYVVANPAPYERWIRLSGATQADKQVILVARSSGVISTLPAKEGETLDEGGLVMGLDGPEKYAAVDSAKAQYESAAHVAETNKELRARGTLPQLQLEASIATREATRSALEAARAEVDRLEVHAPFAGVVDHVYVEIGSWVEPGTQVASLLALDPIVVVGEIGERDLQSVDKGTTAAVAFGDGSTAEGEVRYVRREASGLTRTFPIEVAVSNPSLTIPAGMSAEMRLSVKTDPAVILPRSAITLDADGNLGVRVLDAGDKVAFQKVAILDDTPDGLALAGIAKGTRIIVLGQDMVAVGQEVAAVEAAAQTAGQQGSN